MNIYSVILGKLTLCELILFNDFHKKTSMISTVHHFDNFIKGFGMDGRIYLY